jgi:hypothetical protein
MQLHNQTRKDTPMTTAPDSSPGHEHDHVRVTVRTPAGASHTFTFEKNELVVSATATAVEHFVKARELASDDYGHALIRAGEAVPMLDTDELRTTSSMATYYTSSWKSPRSTDDAAVNDRR